MAEETSTVGDELRKELGTSPNDLEAKIAGAAELTPTIPEPEPYREPKKPVAVSLIQRDLPTSGNRGALVELPGELAALVENQRQNGRPTHVLDEISPALEQNFPSKTEDTVDYPGQATETITTLEPNGDSRVEHNSTYAGGFIQPGDGVQLTSIALIEAAAEARPLQPAGQTTEPTAYYGHAVGLNGADVVLILRPDTVRHNQHAYADFKAGRVRYAPQIPKAYQP
jgi:hypothetical protein